MFARYLCHGDGLCSRYNVFSDGIKSHYRNIFLNKISNSGGN